MEVKVMLCFVLFACVWYADGCHRPSIRHLRSLEYPAERQEGSVEKNGGHYSVTLQAHPCRFDTYDADRDGEISKREVQAILGIAGETDSLFAELNIMPDDGVIKPEEFYAKVPQIITQCLDTTN
ncbi:uncharacterized protein LOC123527749 [Mercenaria mercenaria]|uniref:uncharacterized protein LOC123527749 n=1 Tax=Mercenaria mercenaria TaxID=6596 RepID=UPI00234FA094|nr:uncharacterized protein LOC123527749 [Mercenaria mercenaria]